MHERLVGGRVLQLDELELEEVRAHGGVGKIRFRRVFEGTEFEGPWNFVDYAVLPPGSSIGPHRHGANEELYLVLEGEGVVLLDGEELQVRPGTVILNRSGGTHGLRNDSREAIRLFVVEVAVQEEGTSRQMKKTRITGTPDQPAPMGFEDTKPQGNEPAPIALVIAGGEGTRLARSHPGVPKPLAKLAGLPMIEITVRQLLQAGVRDIRFALRHRADEIVAYFDAAAGFDQAVFTYLIEEEPLGTIGALSLLRDEPGAVLVTNGDLLSGIDLNAMIRHHRRHGGALTIATHLEHHRLKLGEVVTGANRRIVEYREKPVKEYRISSGTYVVESTVRALVEEHAWLGFPTLVDRALAARLPVVEYFHEEPWMDVNDREDLGRAEELLRKDPVAFGVDPDWLE